MRIRVPAILVVSVLFLVSSVSAASAQATPQYVNCSQVQGAFASQGQYANAIASGDNSEAVVEVSQELNISQDQVNACLGGGTGRDNTPPGEDGNDGGDGEAEEAEGPRAVKPGTAAVSKLPNTGGPSLLGVALGLALVAGGISLTRPRR